MSIVTGDLTDFSGTLDRCASDGEGGAVLSCGHVDDVIIAFAVRQIDGAGNVLGSAGPEYVRPQVERGSGLPISGFMQFDEADMRSMLSAGVASSVVEHEMGHVLGLGTLWSLRSLLDPANCAELAVARETFSARYTGPQGIRALPGIGYTGDSRPPVEDQGGGGTACGHWKEASLGSELMTGWVSRGAPLSRLTAWSLADLGYEVDFGSRGIDAFDVGAAARALGGPGAGIAERVRMVDCQRGWTGAKVPLVAEVVEGG
ncbi:hypothetical protein DFJ74DRAFT_682296 [Hyaloraphidium curvatum]|nr:hypothetical protein DFJ74DRAFT_682296 [Hyaloraphidium curvatum]